VDPADTGAVTKATLDIVPPRRLGLLLADARADRGLTIDDVASRSGLDAGKLALIESGESHLTEAQLATVLTGYGTTLEELLPVRKQVVLDLDGGQLLVAEEVVALQDAPTADDVLSAYLSLVYTLRRATPGEAVVLRGFDVAVLAKALDLAEPEVETRLHDLMASPTAEVSRLTKVFRSKLLLPIVGAVVVATALGTVLVLRNDDRSTPPPTGVRTTEVPPAEVIPPANQERNSDGSSGPVQEVAP
jgi:transcriptional regulator with XRE-family HTH domain